MDDTTTNSPDLAATSDKGVVREESHPSIPLQDIDILKICDEIALRK